MSRKPARRTRAGGQPPGAPQRDSARSRQQEESGASPSSTLPWAGSGATETVGGEHLLRLASAAAAKGASAVPVARQAPPAAATASATAGPRSGRSASVPPRRGRGSTGSATLAADSSTGSPPPRASQAPSPPLQVLQWTCAPLQDAEPQGLALTYWFDAAPAGEPYPVSVRFTGQRLSDNGTAVPGESFEVVHTLPLVLPGSGRVAFSAHVPGLHPGRWRVTAQPVRSPAAADGRAVLPPGLRRGTTTGATMFLPVARVRAPGARLGIWPSLVLAGTSVALILQFLLAAARHLPAGRLLVWSLLACLLGLVGAKVYYLATHPQERGNPLRAGMSVQGFVLAAIGVLLTGGWVSGIPLGPMLDVTAPGLLFGLAIGRVGCFFGGCCAGRPTASRWGVWSSDRRVGVRRIPVQWLESTWAGILAAGTMTAVLLLRPAVDGLLFVAGLAAYIAGRQVLFPLRAIPRKTRWVRPTTLVVTALTTAGAVTWLVVPLP